MSASHTLSWQSRVRLTTTGKRRPDVCRDDNERREVRSSSLAQIVRVFRMLAVRILNAAMLTMKTSSDCRRIERMIRIHRSIDYATAEFQTSCRGMVTYDGVAAGGMVLIDGGWYVRRARESSRCLARSPKVLASLQCVSRSTIL